ncbi:MAG: sigma-70 family RNA polymerase sigma factor [Muribaculaceae bacterium]|nr:sigma-70 family RNA polymerase sigma factor [Muribaculaceae bacterium]
MKKDNLTYSFLALRDKLHRSAIAFLKNEEDAKDALQDTFFNLWRNGEVDTEPAARNKLFAVLRNVCIDRLRRPRTLGIDNINTEVLEADSIQFEDMERYEALLTSGLSDIQRQIYSLVSHNGMEYDAIAEYLKMSVEAVRMNMSRARKKIRENYKRLENESARR